MCVYAPKVGKPKEDGAGGKGIPCHGQESYGSSYTFYLRREGRIDEGRGNAAKAGERVASKAY